MAVFLRRCEADAVLTLDKRIRCVRRAVLWALSALTMVGGPGGCSFALVDRPPSRKEWPEASYQASRPCTESWLLPVIDGAIVFGAVGDSIYESKANEEGDIWFVPQVIIGIVYAASAIYGFVEADRCSEYHAGPPYPSAGLR